MKTTTLLILFSAVVTVATATDTAAPCCTPLVATKPSCCAEIKPAAPLSARSLYQLDASWSDDTGQTQSLKTLRGRPVVIAMFFAQCEYACPIIVSDITRLRAAIPEDVRDAVQLVLVTFDTARDTSTALAGFRARMSLDSSWKLLRGEVAAVQELAMLLGVKFKQDGRGQFAHSNLLTVLNGEGEIVHQLAGLNGDVSQTAKVVATLTNAMGGKK